MCLRSTAKEACTALRINSESRRNLSEVQPLGVQTSRIPLYAWIRVLLVLSRPDAKLWCGEAFLTLVLLLCEGKGRDLLMSPEVRKAIAERSQTNTLSCATKQGPSLSHSSVCCYKASLLQQPSKPRTQRRYPKSTMSDEEMEGETYLIICWQPSA